MCSVLCMITAQGAYVPLWGREEGSCGLSVGGGGGRQVSLLSPSASVSRASPGIYMKTCWPYLLGAFRDFQSFS